MSGFLEAMTVFRLATRIAQEAGQLIEQMTEEKRELTEEELVVLRERRDQVNASWAQTLAALEADVAAGGTLPEMTPTSPLDSDGGTGAGPHTAARSSHSQPPGGAQPAVGTTAGTDPSEHGGL